MKKTIYFLLIAAFFSACNSSLNEKKVEEFVVNHFETINESPEAVVQAIKDNISDSVMMFNFSNGYIGRPEWINDHSKIKTEWFYEDSVNVDIKSVEVFGNVASVYGSVAWFMSGEKTSRAGFHSIIGKEMGKLVFIETWSSLSKNM